MLGAEQRKGLPSLIATAERRLDGPRGEDMAAVVRGLTNIGMRVAPATSDAAAAGWVKGLTDSFGRMPADLLRKAVDDARYRQFQFLNEVGPWIEAQVAEPARIRRVTLNRLMEIQLKAAALPPPGEERCSPEAVDSIMAEFGLRTAAKTRPEPHAYKGPPPGGWMLADPAAEHNAIIAQLEQMNRLRAGLGRKPMTQDEEEAQFAAIADARRNNGPEPSHPRAEAA